MEPLGPQRKGRPPVPYVLAAYELIELWEALTGRKAVYPKGSAKGEDDECEAVQPSTEFIRLALKMIDPDVTNAQVITCLKHVFDINKNRKDNPYTRDHLFPQPIIDVMRTGGSANDFEEAVLRYQKERACLINPGKSV